MDTLKIPDIPQRARKSSLAKRPNLEIEFQDLSYTVRAANSSGSKQILKNINGRFRSGELTAMMGPSGAGKSTLMNVLAGYVSAGVTGTITTNGYPRDMKRFTKLSCYIMQEDLLQPRLTVHEALCISAKLKVGSEQSNEEKLMAVDEIITTLGLTVCRNTRTERLSGGQRKRLSVALELVNNPPVIFLDEPTTGLDIVSITQLLELLHKLAQQGRTIICTIHQPTASMFNMFDQVYMLAQGYCVYNGCPQQLVPFMDSVGFSCPKNNNPADFVIETLQMDGDVPTLFSNETQNGKINRRQDGLCDSAMYKDRIDRLQMNSSVSSIYGDTVIESIFKVSFATSFWTQFSILLRRMFLQTRRNQSLLWIQLAHHVLLGILFGGCFFGIGNDAVEWFTNFKFCICIVVFFMYTQAMTPVLLFPQEVKLLRREYFNRWYSLKAYYAALTVSTLPLLIILSILFMTICYTMSYQPMTFERFGLFCLIGILLAMCSEGLGLTIGSICSITNGSIVGPAILAPMLALCVYGMGYGKAIEPFMAFLQIFSFLRYGLVGFSNAIFGLNRGDLECNNEIYCHYKDPQLLLRDLGMEDCTITAQIIGIVIFTTLYRLTAYLALRYRLTAEFSNKILNYAAKVLRHK